MPTIDVRRAESRATTQLDWLDSRHSFNFGEHQTPLDNGHGLLIVSNDDRVQPGRGFGVHSHRNVEIVTWVLSGRLAHVDSEGNSGELYPGLAQKMSAGRGIRHSEMNASSSELVRFVQMWVKPDNTDSEPSYEQLDLNVALQAGGLHAVASGREDVGAIRIGQSEAVLWAGRLISGEAVAIPAGPHVHVFVAIGAIDVERAGLISEGDAMRLEEAGAFQATAGPDGAEILIWVTA